MCQGCVCVFVWDILCVILRVFSTCVCGNSHDRWFWWVYFLVCVMRIFGIPFIYVCICFGLLVCHSFLKELKVTLPCSYRSTGLFFLWTQMCMCNCERFLLCMCVHVCVCLCTSYEYLCVCVCIMLNWFGLKLCLVVGANLCIYLL